MANSKFLCNVAFGSAHPDKIRARRQVICWDVDRAGLEIFLHLRADGLASPVKNGRDDAWIHFFKFQIEAHRVVCWVWSEVDFRVSQHVRWVFGAHDVAFELEALDDLCALPACAKKAAIDLEWLTWTDRIAQIIDVE